MFLFLVCSVFVYGPAEAQGLLSKSAGHLVAVAAVEVAVAIPIVGVVAAVIVIEIVIGILNPAKC